MADVLEFEFGMEGDAGGLIGVNGGDDNAMASFASADDQVLKED
jgi:hypothetical protein